MIPLKWNIKALKAIEAGDRIMVYQEIVLGKVGSMGHNVTVIPMNELSCLAVFYSAHG